VDTRCPGSLFKSRACFTRKALGAPASALHDIFHSDLPESFCRPVLGVHLQTRLEDEKQRLLALAAVHDVMNRSEAARIGGMDRQTLRDWVHRFNEYGPEGLIDIKPPGRPSKLSEKQIVAVSQFE